MLKSIKKKDEFKRIFNSGITVFSSDKKLKAILYYPNRKNPPEINYAIAVSSKSGNSVWRNRLKRLLREAIRAELSTLIEIMSEANRSIDIIFMSASVVQKNHRKIFLRDIQPAVIDILKKIKCESSGDRQR